ncbi:MAG: TolC family protein [Alphaproteobacteria bacterium]|nr:TolC family protein [Alphaproteobacteria bacterium]
MIARTVIAAALLWSALLGATTPATAQNSGPPGGASIFARTTSLSLSEAVALMLRDNRTVRSALLNRIVDDFSLRVAEDQFNPQFDFSAAVSRSRPQRGPGEPSVSSTMLGSWQPRVTLLLPYGTQLEATARGAATRVDGSGTVIDQRLDLSIVQPLLRGGGRDVTTATLEIARVNRKVQAFGLERSVSGSIVLAIQSYRTLMQAGEQVRIAEDSLRRARDLVEVNRQLVSAGRLAAVEIVQSEANVARQELAVLQARNTLDGARLDLLQILALDVNIGLVPTERLTAERVHLEVPKALETARANRTDYRQALLLLDVAKLNLLLAKDGLRWELNAVGSLSVSAADRSVTELLRRAGRTQPGTGIGLELRIPISNLSDQQRAVASRVAVRQQELAIADLEQRLEVQVRNALRTLDTTWRAMQLAEQSVDLSQRKLEIERLRLRAGRSSNFQVVTFEDDLVRARTDLLSARISYLNALTNADDVLGTTLRTWGVQVEAL